MSLNLQIKVCHTQIQSSYLYYFTVAHTFAVLSLLLGDVVLVLSNSSQLHNNATVDSRLRPRPTQPTTSTYWSLSLSNFIIESRLYECRILRPLVNTSCVS